LEAAYLARGQSRQLAETEQAIQQLESMALLEFGPNARIDLSALVELEGKGERAFYFILPRAGGTEILQEKMEILVITPQSPLGQQLMGKKQGDRLKMEIGGQKNEYRVASVR
jgi:transcription elongation GreA/GreB family factor